MVIEWTARQPAPDDTLEQAVRDVRRLVDASPDGAGRLAVVAELERLERKIAARGAAAADGLRLARALVEWVAHDAAAKDAAATRH